MASKKELLGFLDTRVFDPILKAKKQDYRESDQKALADVQGSTKSEKARFHVNAELRRLKRPRLPDVKKEFLEMADGEKSGERTKGTVGR